MSGYLLDTNIILWSIDGYERLSNAQREIVEHAPDIYFSIASVWEMAIKASIGKLRVPDKITDHLLQMNYKQLQISTFHAEAIRQLPHLHRDPFDRLLICQAQTEHLTLITSDKNIRRYDVDTI